MIGQAGQWTQTPSATPLQPKTWYAHFWITFNFWWSAGLVDGLEHHLPPLYSHKNQMLIFGLRSTSDDWPGWSMDSNPICHLSAATKMKCSFLDYVQLLMIGWAGRWTQTPSPAKIMKCSFLDYIQLLMISWAGQWTQTLSATCLQPQKWNAHLWITFNFWWLAGLVNGLEPHLPPLSSHKKEMLIFGLHSTSDDQLAGQWTRTPSTIPLQPKKWNAHFWITFNFWWLAGMVDGLKPHMPPLSSQKNEILVFGLRPPTDDRQGWSMDSNPIHHPSPAKNMKCSFLDYVQLLMIRWPGWWTQTPSATPLQPEKWNAHFWIMFNFWWSARLVDGLEPHPPPLCI